MSIEIQNLVIEINHLEECYKKRKSKGLLCEIFDLEKKLFKLIGANDLYINPETKEVMLKSPA